MKQKKEEYPEIQLLLIEGRIKRLNQLPFNSDREKEIERYIGESNAIKQQITNQNLNRREIGNTNTTTN